MENTFFFLQDRFNYIEDANLNAKIIELPYKSSTISMFVFLPNDYEGVSDLQSKLKIYDLTKVTTGMTSQRVALSLPKFQISFPITLNDILSQVKIEELIMEWSKIKNDFPFRWVWVVSLMIRPTFLNSL